MELILLTSSKFKVDLASETNVVKIFELFDRSVLLRMKLINLPTQPLPRTQPPRTYQSSTTYFDDAYHNTLTVQVMELKTQQVSMLKSQASLFQNQTLLMEHFASMQIRMDRMYEDQQETLQILQSQFPPPPPSGSNMSSQQGV